LDLFFANFFNVYTIAVDRERSPIDSFSGAAIGLPTLPEKSDRRLGCSHAFVPIVPIVVFHRAGHRDDGWFSNYLLAPGRWSQSRFRRL
jgi:hypothetical protein